MKTALGSGGWTDDRINCATCARMNGRGSCDAYKALGALRGYVPLIQPRRCAEYQPKPNQRDQRNGRARWHWLKEV